jgi:diadenosine tetraphosphate (Ap4A) HIT family hydrolase
LVVPARHVADFFALSAEEQADVWRLVAEVRVDLARRFAPDGFNVGLNAGLAAGQTVDHAHIHVIPRFAGDVPDPRGGVRWVLPAKAAYWDDE